VWRRLPHFEVEDDGAGELARVQPRSSIASAPDTSVRTPGVSVDRSGAKCGLWLLGTAASFWARSSPGAASHASGARPSPARGSTPESGLRIAA
jgi:hypothetical protein